MESFSYLEKFILFLMFVILCFLLFTTEPEIIKDYDESNCTCGEFHPFSMNPLFLFAHSFWCFGFQAMCYFDRVI